MWYHIAIVLKYYGPVVIKIEFEGEKMRKKVWSKPELLVLVRGKPAEAVLTGCKSSYDWNCPESANSACYQSSREMSCFCDQCSGLVSS